VPSRKQRRRRTKDRRHDYEYVFVDDEGNEVDADDVPQPSRNGSGRGAVKPDAPIRVAGGRVVKPASWQRAVRRGFLFAPAMFAILFFLNRGHLAIAGVLLNTLILLAFFIPFGFLMDKMMYRTYVRKQAAGKAKARPKAKAR
jgi:hypothetical protein